MKRLKPKPNCMLDYDNITHQLRKLLQSRPENCGDSLCKVKISSNKQSLIVYENSSNISDMVSNREAARKNIENPSKLVLRAENKRLYPKYSEGMSTKHYVKEYIKLLSVARHKDVIIRQMDLKNFDNRLSFFQELNDSPAAVYDRSYPEVVLEIIV